MSKYKIEDIPTPNKHKIKTDILLPDMPFRMLMIGNSGSGKNTTLFNILANKKFPYMKKFKGNIWVIAPTLKLERRWEMIGVPEDQMEEDADKIDEFIDEVKEHQENTGYKPCCIIFDDIIPVLNQSNKSGVNKLFISMRHWNMSGVILSQAYRQGIPKVCRLQATSMIIYKVNNKEQMAIYEENCPELSFDDFQDLFKEATKERYSFLQINYDNKEEDRYIKNFDTILRLE